MFTNFIVLYGLETCPIKKSRSQITGFCSRPSFYEIIENKQNDIIRQCQQFFLTIKCVSCQQSC